MAAQEIRTAQRLARSQARAALSFPTWRPTDAEVAAAMTTPKPAAVARKCTRCKGTGAVPMYAHIDNGRCMACLGTKVTHKVSGAAQKRWSAEFAGIALPRIEAIAAKIKAVMATMPEAAKQGERQLADLRRHWAANRASA